MKKLWTAVALAALLTAIGGSALADDISADTITYDGKTKVVTAKGNVVIHANQGATITGTQGEYHFEDRSAYLEGGVKYVKEATSLVADKMYLYKDKTARGVGSVYFHDGAENRILRGDDVMYNSDTGFGKIEGNLKQVKIVATGGVNLTSTANNATGYGDQAVYTRSGQNGTDGKLVLSGNAWVNQNGNSFNGPELVLRDADKVVETTGRSTIVITNTGSEASNNDSGSDAGSSAPQGPVTQATPIAGRPEYAGAPLETKEDK